MKWDEQTPPREDDRLDAERLLVFVAMSCAMHPDGGEHECMANERRCAYCAAPLHPLPCEGCGKFLTVARMHPGNHRCEDCQ